MSALNGTRDANRKALLWLVATSFLVRCAFYTLAKNYDGDPFVRSFGALQWSKSPYYVWHADSVTWVFGPLPFYLNGIALMIWNNVLQAPRLVSLLLGSLAIIPFFKLIATRLSTRETVYASIIFCFYTLQVRFSAVTASDSVNSFFVLWTVYFFFEYNRNQRLSLLLVSAITMNLALMVRYDNLPIILLLASLLFITDNPVTYQLKAIIQFKWQKLRIAVVFIAISSIYIASRFWGDYAVYGDPIYSLPIGKPEHGQMLQRALIHQGAFVHYLYTVFFWPGVAFLSVTPAAALLALIGIASCVRRRRCLHFGVISATLLLMYVFESAVGESVATFARFTITFTLFAIPFAGIGWNIVCERIRESRRRGFDIAIAGSIIAIFTFLAIFGIEGRNTVQDKLQSISPISRLPVYTERVLQWMNENIPLGEKVVIDGYRDESDLLYMYSKHPYGNLLRRWRTTERLADYLESDKPQYVIYAHGGAFRKFIELDTNKLEQTKDGMAFSRRFTENHYAIFEISYSKVR